MEDIKRKIKEFLKKYYRIEEQNEFEDITAFGLINSLFAMQMILFLEKEFKIRITSEDLKPENFQTIHSISKLVQKKFMEGVK